MSGTKSIDKALTVLKHLLDAEGEVRVDELAERLDMPLATIYRHITALERSGLISRESRSLFSPGVFLRRRFDTPQFHEFLTAHARPIVIDLSEKLNLTVHLGVFEDDMVTYLVKSAIEGSTFFTRETAQLDAYCSGLGKVLLAGLPEKKLDAYFAGGALPRLTAATITEESELRSEILAVAERGYALDDEEFEEGLFCVATPVFDRDHQVIAALSASSHEPAHVGANLKKVVAVLENICMEIQQALYSSD